MKELLWRLFPITKMPLSLKTKWYDEFIGKGWIYFEDQSGNVKTRLQTGDIQITVKILEGFLDINEVVVNEVFQRCIDFPLVSFFVTLFAGGMLLSGLGGFLDPHIFDPVYIALLSLLALSSVLSLFYFRKVHAIEFLDFINEKENKINKQRLEEITQKESEHTEFQTDTGNICAVCNNTLSENDLQCLHCDWDNSPIVGCTEPSMLKQELEQARRA